MIVKCNKTGKILFSTDEASKHAEEIGSQDFTEIAADAQLLVDAETKNREYKAEKLQMSDKASLKASRFDYELSEISELNDERVHALEK